MFSQEHNLKVAAVKRQPHPINMNNNNHAIARLEDSPSIIPNFDFGPQITII
jgi:hypothetical protein